MSTYSLTLRGDLGRKLTTEELDGNFTYLEGLIGTASGTQGPQGPQGPAGGGGLINFQQLKVSRSILEIKVLHYLAEHSGHCLHE